MSYLCLPINLRCWSGLKPDFPPVFKANLMALSFAGIPKAEASCWALVALELNALKKVLFQLCPAWLISLKADFISQLDLSLGKKTFPLLIVVPKIFSYKFNINTNTTKGLL